MWVLKVLMKSFVVVEREEEKAGCRREVGCFDLGQLAKRCKVIDPQPAR
jgi:hypothetical protein